MCSLVICLSTLAVVSPKRDPKFCYPGSCVAELQTLRFYVEVNFVFTGVQVLWGLLQMATGIGAGYYGTGVIGEPGSAQSGLVFFNGFAISLGYRLTGVRKAE